MITFELASAKAETQCLERANFQAMIKALGGESETVIINRSGHWAVGWVESILIHESDLKALKVANEIMESFQDYPIIDVDTLFEVDQEELESTFDFFRCEFVQTILDLVGIESESDLSPSELKEVESFAYAVLSHDKGYRGVEDSFVTNKSIGRLAEDQYSGIESNILNLVRAVLNIEVSR